MYRMRCAKKEKERIGFVLKSRLKLGVLLFVVVLFVCLLLCADLLFYRFLDVLERRRRSMEVRASWDWRDLGVSLVAVLIPAEGDGTFGGCACSRESCCDTKTSS